MNLSDLGFDDRWAIDFEERARPRGSRPARVVRASRSTCWIRSDEGESKARVPGRLHRSGLVPVVGDWVALASAGRGEVVDAVLPRRTEFRRRAAGGRGQTQVVAANLDRLLVVMGLDGDFNVRRLERYLALATGSEVEAVVVLNKADRCPDVPDHKAQVEAVSGDAPVVVLSALEGNVSGLSPFLVPRETLALIGSSGVGKSTILNALAGDERMATGPVRLRDQRGRHTTTHRELFQLPTGALLIDTPGMRELGMVDGSAAAVALAFPEIAALVDTCQFRNCRHDREPGCAVLAAVERGDVDEDRLDSFRRLDTEARQSSRRR